MGRSTPHRLRLPLWLLAAAAAGCAPELPPALEPDQPTGADAVTGDFRVVEGVKVLTLWGTPYQRGYAHGRLAAQGVLDVVDAVCGSNLLLERRGDYERVILPMMDRFAFEPDDETELRGLLEGVRAALGERALLKRIGRTLTLADLKACNTAGDWYRQACSSFAAWGTRATDGHVWVGRNFDFLPDEAFFAHQMIVVHRPDATKKGWAGVSAAGMIGPVTAINEHGVFVAVHDAFQPLRPLERGYAPRLLVLRRLVETCEARDLTAQALPILHARRQMFDSSILLAAPVADGSRPAVVFEYDGDQARTGGVTVRTSDDNEPKLSRELLACTNHFRKRAAAGVNLLRYRYPLMRQVLMAKTGRGERVDFDIARKTMGAVRLPITVHTVIADLHTLDFWYAPGAYLSPPGNRDYVKLPVKDWLAPRP